LGISFDARLAVLAAPAARLEAAQRQRGVHAAGAVDADRAGLEAAGEAVGHADVAGPDAGGQAVFGLVAHAREAVGVILAGKARGAQDRAEDFLAADFHARFGIHQQRRLDEPAGPVHAIAADHHRRAFLAAAFD